MEDLISKYLFTFGPFAIGWLVAAFFLWREFKKPPKEDADATIKIYKEIVDAYREDMQETRELVAALTVKVDTMWDFIMRRAKGEIVSSGLGTLNSPVVLTAAAQAILNSQLRDSLRDLYLETGPDISDNDLALLIEQRFGEILLTEVCIPHELHLGACLMLAIDAAKSLVCDH